MNTAAAASSVPPCAPRSNRPLRCRTFLPFPQPRLGRYRHYKGGEYEVLGVARHSETLEALVVYRPLYNDTGLWVRPYAMFFERGRARGPRQPRFAPLVEPA